MDKAVFQPFGMGREAERLTVDRWPTTKDKIKQPSLVFD